MTKTSKRIITTALIYLSILIAFCLFLIAKQAMNIQYMENHKSNFEFRFSYNKNPEDKYTCENQYQGYYHQCDLPELLESNFRLLPFYLVQAFIPIFGNAFPYTILNYLFLITFSIFRAKKVD